MDADLRNRIESLESLVAKTLEAVNSLRSEFIQFREEQRKHDIRTEAILEQLTGRVGRIEGRIGAVEERVGAIEKAVFR